MSKMILHKYRKERDRLYDVGRELDPKYHQNLKKIKCYNVWILAEQMYFNAVDDYFGKEALVNQHSGEVKSEKRIAIPISEFYEDLMWSINEKERRIDMANQKSRGRPRKFDRETARAIRKAVREGLSVTEAAKTHGVGVMTINKVVKGEGAYANTL